MIELQQFNESDFERLISWIDNEDSLVQFAGTIFSFPLTKEQLNSYVSDKKRFPYKVIKKENEEVIGHAEIYFSDNTTAKLCRVLIGDEHSRGKGYGQQIIKMLMQTCFKQVKVKEIELNVFDWNIAAINCYEKVGFKINSSKNKITRFNNKEWLAINMTFSKQV
jgi:RimJ/RimL family protein N-acetyltransferase